MPYYKLSSNMQGTRCLNGVGVLFPSAIYPEPHGVFDKDELFSHTAAIFPIVSQQIGSYKLLNGNEESA
ncbi:hypothetical protein EON63_17160 [archaeon]|nr:MAG: hypothetical protein EON63_17160 [archaeon]